jgi:hypothetical protein
MQKTTEFLVFMQLYEAVTRCPELTLAEKTAAIEAASDEFMPRLQPGAYREIVKRLAALPPREHHAESKVKQEPPATTAHSGQRKDTAGRMASRVRR